MEQTRCPYTPSYTTTVRYGTTAAAAAAMMAIAQERTLTPGKGAVALLQHPEQLL